MGSGDEACCASNNNGGIDSDGEQEAAAVPPPPGEPPSSDIESLYEASTLAPSSGWHINVYARCKPNNARNCYNTMKSYSSL